MLASLRGTGAGLDVRTMAPYMNQGGEEGVAGVEADTVEIGPSRKILSLQRVRERKRERATHTHTGAERAE